MPNKKVIKKVEEAIGYLIAGEGYDYNTGITILYDLLDGNLEKNRRGWRKKVKEAYNCFSAEVNDFQKGIDLLLQIKGERLKVYVEREKDHESIEVDKIE